MTQIETIETLSKNTGLSKYRINKVLIQLNKLIAKTLLEGKRFPLSGIGKLSTIDTKERIGINPQTLKSINIPKSKRVKFTVSSILRKKVKKV